MPDPICPQCKNPVYDEEALLCHFCGGSLGRASGGFLGRMRGAGNRWIWIMIVVIVTAAVALSMF